MVSYQCWSEEGLCHVSVVVQLVHGCIRERETKDDVVGWCFGNDIISCFLYEGYAVLLAESEADLQSVLSRLGDICVKRGMRINLNKSKVVYFGRTEDWVCCSF